MGLPAQGLTSTAEKVERGALKAGVFARPVPRFLSLEGCALPLDAQRPGVLFSLILNSYLKA